MQIYWYFNEIVCSHIWMNIMIAVTLQSFLLSHSLFLSTSFSFSFVCLRYFSHVNIVCELAARHFTLQICFIPINILLIFIFLLFLKCNRMNINDESLTLPNCFSYNCNHVNRFHLNFGKFKWNKLICDMRQKKKKLTHCDAFLFN